MQLDAQKELLVMNLWVIFPDDLIDSERPCLKQMMDIHSSTNSSVVAIESVNKKDVDKYGIINFSSRKNNFTQFHLLMKNQA